MLFLLSWLLCGQSETDKREHPNMSITILKRFKNLLKPLFLRKGCFPGDFQSLTFLAGHGENATHMDDPHCDPQTSPQHADPHGFPVWSSLRRPQVHVDRRVVGWSAGRDVDRPCGGGNFRHGLVEKSLTQEAKRPLRHSEKRPIEVGRRPVKEGKKTH